MTVNHASVFIDSPYWDKNLAFVAMTRHRETLNIYANKHYHADIESLTKTLSRSTTKDNVIDWPLDFAMRAGFDLESLIGKTINFIAKTAYTIKDKWNYIVNYEDYLNEQVGRTKITTRQNVRATAKQVAKLLDEASDLRKQFKKIEKEAGVKGVKHYELPQFKELYERSIERDKQAAQILKAGSLEKAVATSKIITSIKTYAERYERYQAIEALAKITLTERPAVGIIRQSAKINLEKDTLHITRLATKHDKCPQKFKQQIKHLQYQYKQYTWSKL